MFATGFIVCAIGMALVLAGSQIEKKPLATRLVWLGGAFEIIGLVILVMSQQ